MGKLGVVYLARGSEGLASMVRFAETYKKHPAGIDHDLVVIFKGIDKRGARAAAGQIFADIAARIIEIDDTGYDIHAYQHASRVLDHEHLCFFNTYTELQSDGWLKKMYDVATRPGVGVVGTTASYESLYDSIAYISKAVWLAAIRNVRYDHRLAEHFAPLIDVHGPGWMTPYYSRKTRLRTMISDLKSGRIPYDDPSVEAQWDAHWDFLIGKEGPLTFYANFQRYPNPHLRSNGFLMRRKLFLELNYMLENTKEACVIFESGPDGMPNRIRRQGLQSLLVGADGVGYATKDWPTSRTFRLEQQQNLITTDNQVRNYTGFSKWERAYHARITWGDYIAPQPPGYIDLGFAFAVNRAVTDSPELNGGAIEAEKVAI